MADEVAVVASPCIDVCRMDSANDLCQGCLRTLAEIAGWAQMDAAAKRAVWTRLAQRRSELAAPLQGPA